ncbi:MAG: SCO family protein [Calditrichae bacterium]|nr:SCO family protein [Calditrichota bacterium]MCB9058042.1 SCO family protein [Calditrichia bacterium]
MKKLIPALILLVLMISAVFIAQSYLNRKEIPKLYSVPDFSFETYKGEAFNNSNFSNKISVVDFIFTNCPGLCPAMSRKLASLYDDYSGEDKIQFVSFSVDPARDSVQALQDYADRWGVNDQRWQFIRTDKQGIDSLYENGFKLGGELPHGHSASLVLVDNNGVIRGYYNYDDDAAIEQMKKDLETLAGNI